MRALIEQDETLDFDPSLNSHKTMGPSDHTVSARDLVDAQDYLHKLRQQHVHDLPLAQKLELVLQRTDTAEHLARMAAKTASDLQLSMRNELAKIHQHLERLASGQPLAEPDEPGSSIFDP